MTATSTAPKADKTEKARTKLCATIFSEPGTPTKLLSARKEPERWWLVTKSLTTRPDQMVLTLWSKEHIEIEISLVGKDPFRIFLYEKRCAVVIEVLKVSQVCIRPYFMLLNIKLSAVRNGQSLTVHVAKDALGTISRDKHTRRQKGIEQCF